MDHKWTPWSSKLRKIWAYSRNNFEITVAILKYTQQIDRWRRTSRSFNRYTERKYTSSLSLSAVRKFTFRGSELSLNTAHIRKWTWQPFPCSQLATKHAEHIAIVHSLWSHAHKVRLCHCCFGTDRWSSCYTVFRFVPPFRIAWINTKQICFRLSNH